MNKGLAAESFLNKLADGSRKNGEIWRPSFTPEYWQARDLVKSLMLENGLEVREDGVGTLYGTYRGKTDRLVLTGSHLDTVQNGGVYDGAAGVVLPILALGELKREGFIPEKNIAVIVMYEEEGSRYPSSYLTSRMITGVMKPVELDERDVNGISIREAMLHDGYDPGALESAVIHDADAFVELHIEQGPRLENEGLDIGIVENIVGLYSYEITLRGKQSHAGTTPMRLRRDPVLTAARFVDRITERAGEISDTAVITCGAIKSKPQLANVIADHVFFTLDFRDGDDHALMEIDREIEKMLEKCREDGFTVSLVKKCTEKVCHLDAGVARTIQDAADSLNLKAVRMNSGAGHDSQIIAEKIPTAMIFIPSVGGISHSPDEYTRPEDLENGIDIMREVLRKLASEEKGKVKNER